MKAENTTRSYVAYYRVSTNKQGISGLGLEAQKDAVENFIRDGVIIETFTEIESGKRNNREQLKAAIEMCKRKRAILIIAKLDRLARNVAFIANLIESGVEFTAADNPHANKLMVHMLAAFAEHEREMISKRTKEALAVAKSRGVKLGKNGKHLAATNKQAAIDFALSIAPEIITLKQQGITTLRAIAAALNAKGISTYNGKTWHYTVVFDLINRLKAMGYTI